MNYQRVVEIAPEKVIKQIESVMSVFIDERLELAHFLAQCHHESMGFKKVVENMNYSSARLLQVFPKYFNGCHVLMLSNLHLNDGIGIAPSIIHIIGQADHAKLSIGSG